MSGNGADWNLRACRTGNGRRLVVSVAKASAILFSQLLMSPRHTMDSNSGQSVAQGHFGNCPGFLCKYEMLMVTRIERRAQHQEPS